MKIGGNDLFGWGTCLSTCGSPAALLPRNQLSLLFERHPDDGHSSFTCVARKHGAEAWF